MSKKSQQKNVKKAATKKQAQAQSKKPVVSQQQSRKKPAKEPMSWQAIARLVIVILLVLGLAGSMSCGIVASVYALPAEEQGVATQGTFSDQKQRPGSAHALSSRKHTASMQPLLAQEQMVAPLLQHELLDTRRALEGDIIDGNPIESYADITDDLPAVDSPYVGLCTSDGRILFERGIDEKVPTASTTKIMTAIIAIETLPLDTPLTVTAGAANALGTHSGLQEGMVISLIDCLYGLLLPSGNDAAVVIAENISEMEMRFVDLMNQKAEELGMASTHYIDASGLETQIVDASGLVTGENYSTARDYLTLARYCMTNETFRTIVGTSYYEANVDGVVLEWQTTGELSDYLVDADAVGIKTGYTDDAGYCYIGAGNKGGIELYTVVFSAPTAEQRFADTARLLEWGFRHYRTIEIINTSQQVATVALASWIDKTVDAYVPAVIHAEIFDLAGPLTQDITISDIEGEATKGQPCGEIIWMQGKEVLATSTVVAENTVLAPDFFESIGIAWERFWGGFSGMPAHAETKILLNYELAIPSAEPEDKQ